MGTQARPGQQGSMLATRKARQSRSLLTVSLERQRLSCDLVSSGKELGKRQDRGDKHHRER